MSMNQNGGTSTEAQAAYWQASLRLIFLCLAIWFAVSYGAGILFADALNSIQLGGYKLGFWFAQQGSIFTFVALIFFYAWKMNEIDREHGCDEE